MQLVKENELQARKELQNMNLFTNKEDGRQLQEFRAILPSSESTQPISVLKYAKIQHISFGLFVKESASFIGNFYIERIPYLVCFALFNLQNDKFSTEVAGFSFHYTVTLAFLMYDFQEPIGIILGPYYSKLDAYHYKLYKFSLICLNLLLFILCSLMMIFCKPFYRLLNVDPKKLDIYTYYSYLMFFGNFATMVLPNFQKGKYLFILINSNNF